MDVRARQAVGHGACSAVVGHKPNFPTVFYTLTCRWPIIQCFRMCIGTSSGSRVVFRHEKMNCRRTPVNELRWRWCLGSVTILRYYGSDVFREALPVSERLRNDDTMIRSSHRSKTDVCSRSGRKPTLEYRRITTWLFRTHIRQTLSTSGLSAQAKQYPHVHVYQNRLVRSDSAGFACW